MSILDFLLKLIAYIAPYFFIPWTFKWAGGVFASLSGMVNDRGKGIFDRSRNKRAKTRKETMERAKDGNRWQGKNALSRRMNRGTGYAMNFSRKNAGIGLLTPSSWTPSSVRANMKQTMSNVDIRAGRKAQESNEHYDAIKGNDDFLEAGLLSEDANELSAELARRGYHGNTNAQAVAAIMQAQKSMGSETFKAIAAVDNAATGTGYAGGYGDLAAALNDAAGDDRIKFARLLAEARGKATSARRPDLAGAGYGLAMDLGNKMQEGRLTQDEVTDTYDGAVLDGQASSQIVYARKNAIERLAPKMVERAERALQSGTESDIADVLAPLAGYLDAMGAAQPENQKVLSNILARQTANGTIILDEINARRGDAQYVEFNTKRREYEKQGLGAAQQAANAQAAAQAGNQVPPGAQQGPPNPLNPSDRRIKRNLQPTGTFIDSNIPQYFFQYLWSDKIYVGVIAQEVMETRPEAISIADSGYYLVNYSLLGTRMYTKEEWMSRFATTSSARQ